MAVSQSVTAAVLDMERTTIDSHYLVVQATLWNTLWYLYLDISIFKIEEKKKKKKKIEQSHFTNEYVI